VTGKGVLNLPSTLSFGKPQKAKMDSENFKKDITEADLPNSPRHHPCYRKGENPQQSRKLNHTLWSTIDIPTTLEPHPFSKPPRTSISGKRRKPLLSSHGSIFPLFLLQIRHHIFFPDFLCILALHLAASGGTSVHTIARREPLIYDQPYVRAPYGRFFDRWFFSYFSNFFVVF